MIAKGELTSLDVMEDKQYSFIEAEAYIQGIKDSGAPDLCEALKLTRNNLQTLSDAALHYKKTFSANLEILNQALAKAEGK